MKGAHICEANGPRRPAAALSGRKPTRLTRSADPKAHDVNSVPEFRVSASYITSLAGSVGLELVLRRAGRFRVS